MRTAVDVWARGRAARARPSGAGVIGGEDGGGRACANFGQLFQQVTAVCMHAALGHGVTVSVCMAIHVGGGQRPAAGPLSPDLQIDVQAHPHLLSFPHLARQCAWRCMRSAPGHALRPGPWCVLFVLAEPLLCGGRKRCLSITCENKISIVRFGGRTPSWCEAVERDAFVVWHAITDELAECFACRAVGCFFVWHLRRVT